MINIKDEIKTQKKEQDILRGKRLRKLRSMAMLSIAELAQQLGFSRVGVSYWENASRRGLSREGAQRVITLIQEKHNIDCSFNWLWEGKGHEPRYGHPTYAHPFTSVEQEIDLVKKMNSNAMEDYFFKYKVRLDDLDYMGIVGNAQWMIFLERARIDLLEKANLPFSEMKRQQIGGVVAEANIKFLKPAFFDDELEINVRPHSPFSKGLVISYKVKNQHNMDCLVADITIIFVDSNGKSIQLPENIKNKFFE